MITRMFWRGIAACAVLIVSGCASISVVPGSESGTQRMPDRVYVEAFATSGEFNVDRTGADLATFKRGLQLILSTAITTDLSNRLIFSQPLDKNHPWQPENAWLIRGRFVRVNQGSRLLRGAIGFGAGGTKLETQVSVYDLSTNSNVPFLTFETTGGSNAEPGAITAVATDPLTIAVEAVAGGFSGIAHGVTEDAKRTAREITAELSDYMYRRHWISEDRWIQPKDHGDHASW